MLYDGLSEAGTFISSGKRASKTVHFSQIVPDTVVTTTQLAAHTLPLSDLLKKRL